MLGKLRRCCCAQFPGQTARDAHTLPVYVCTCITPALQGRRIVEEIHADLFQNGLGVLFDDLKRLFGQHFEVGNVALDIPCCLKRNRAALCPPCCAAAPTCPSAPCLFRH